MATPPDFVSGAVLTSAQMNAIGLWLVKKQTIGTTVASVTVSDVFSADFDNYRIIINGGVFSADSGGASLTLGATATGYNRGGTFGNFNVTTVSGVSTVNGASWPSVVTGTTVNISCDIILRNPFLAQRTTMSATAMRTIASGLHFSFLGYLDDTTSYTAFTLTNAGTATGGEIRVYGFRN